MAFHVEIEETLVLAYLFHPDRSLTDSDISKLINFLEDLAHTGETYSYRCNAPVFAWVQSLRSDVSLYGFRRQGEVIPLHCLRRGSSLWRTPGEIC